MPLNETQRRALFEVLKLVVDSLASIALSSSNGADAIAGAMSASVAEVSMDINGAAAVLGAHRELYAALETNRDSEQINVGEEVRADWQALGKFVQNQVFVFVLFYFVLLHFAAFDCFYHSLARQVDYKSVEECVKRRRATPNFDPICLADMQVYSHRHAMPAAKAVSSTQFTEVLVQLIRLRELFLEMTPMSEHQVCFFVSFFFFLIKLGFGCWV